METWSSENITLELRGNPDGLVVQSEHKESTGHTEDIDVIVTAVQAVGWLTKKGRREKKILQRKGEE